MIYIGMDVHQKSTVFCFYDASLEKDQRYRLVTRPTTQAAYEEVLRPLEGRSKIAFEVGARTAESIVAFTDVVQRFDDRKRFTSYFGMTPTEDSSGSIRRHGHISKRGPGVVRWLIGEAAHQVIRRCPEMKAFYERVRRGQQDRKKKAIVAVGRKVLAIAYAMLKHEVAFDAAKVTQAA